MPQLYQLSSENEVSITLFCQLCSSLTHYTAIQNSNYLKNIFVIKVATMKNTNNFCDKRKPSHATAKLTLFTVSKEEWNTKEDTGKSMKKAMNILRYAKRHLLGWSEWNIKSIALAII